MQQDSLFSIDSLLLRQVAGPVTCLGKTFANDQERRKYFLALLAEKLKDPEFRKIEGFPIGNDEDILNISDPPYYTACPNPWIGDFVAEWEAQKPVRDEVYHREPFAADVSEGKNDPIYSAHSYHTKVPHKAIMRYILHYTNPGDIVFDGFCGTGMTGVAAQMCGDRDTISSLGYQVKEDGTILQEKVNENGIKKWIPFSKIGARKSLLNDLSPAATFIAYNYNTPIDVQQFEASAKLILASLEDDYGWMYETKHIDGQKGKINYTIWSDVFICPECTNEIIFWNAAVDKDAGEVKDIFSCPHCFSSLTKKNIERVWNTFFDVSLGISIKQAKQTPVLINYTVTDAVSSKKNRYEKKADKEDIDLIEKIDEITIPYWFPISELPDGYNTRQPKNSHGFTHVHHFYTKRNLIALTYLLKISESHSKQIVEIIINMLTRANKQSSLHISNYFNGGGGVCKGHLTGTLYIPSLSPEIPVTKIFGDRISTLTRGYKNAKLTGDYCLSTQSLADMKIKDNSVDFIFIDPPFGSNINYSELNHIDESWQKIWTNNKSEAIENDVQKKGPLEYRQLMASCFKNAYRKLRPGRWMTVEFSNTKSYVWNNIQAALTEAGFIVANVSALDKKQGSFKAVTTPTAVKQDLVISAYKPNGGFEDRFISEAMTEEGVWDFIRTHLKYLPITKVQGQELLFIPERDPRILFDQLIAYYVRRGYTLPIDSKEFQLGLAQHFFERDGMFFLSEQAAEYDKKKIYSGELVQTSLFVKDETSAIDWLRRYLKSKPQRFSEIQPQFMPQLSGWSKNEVMLDLRELLSQNFLCFDGKDEVPEQIHSYLSSNWKELRNLPKNAPALIEKAKDRWYLPDPSKAGDLEKLREKSLLKEFEEYRAAKKKLKLFRIEAVRVGFKKLWELQEFAALINVADKMPSKVLEEDPVLLMYYDQAVTLSQTDTDDEW